jgi:hypothetical protein
MQCEFKLRYWRRLSEVSADIRGLGRIKNSFVAASASDHELPVVNGCSSASSRTGPVIVAPSLGYSQRAGSAPGLLRRLEEVSNLSCPGALPVGR